MPSTTLVWIVGAAVLALVLVLAAWRLRARPPSRGRPHRDSFRSDEDRALIRARRAAIVVNPTKVTDLDEFTSRVRATCETVGWAEPEIHLTTFEDPGTGQAREAVEDGVDVVCVLGGDGTVRAVTEVLAGTNVPLGLLPGGTGNLLARNMGLPLASLEEAVTIALTGHNVRVDVGRLIVDPVEEDAEPRQMLFLVMAGMGFDAAIMGDAREDLKAKVGWPAYVVSGLRNLRGDRFRVHLTVGEDAAGESVEVRTRTVVVGNCGKLLAGITLMPEARIDDGILDCVLLSPKTLAGWVAVGSRVLRQKTTRNERVDHYASPRFVVRPARPQEVQVDGDPLGPARQISTQVWPSALVVRVPMSLARPVKAGELGTNGTSR